METHIRIKKRDVIGCRMDVNKVRIGKIQEDNI